MPGARNGALSAADVLTAARVLIAAAIWPFALAGDGRLVGAGLIAAGATDVLDGYIARRTGRQSSRGARLDAIADAALMLSTAGCLQVLHPEIASEAWPVLTAAAGAYALSLVAGGVDPRQPAGKLAGGLLYLFALLTLLTGVYDALLLDVALLALTVSCLQTILTATRTSQALARLRRILSHTPQASKGVSSSAPAVTRVTTSATPSASDARP
jgi:phosphatidylglycerophosphate synthase